MAKVKKAFLSIFVLFVLAALAACGPQNLGEDETSTWSDNEATEENNTETNEKLSGEVQIDGSSTVYPIAEAVAEEYGFVQPDVKVSVGVSGTGGGFERFIAGETDISNASRPIKDEEKQGLADAGIEYTEFEIAYDGISIVVNKENDWVDYLTVDELKKMWVEDGTVKKWSDIRPEWPDEEIKFFSPGQDSGTFDYFNEEVLDDGQIVKSAQLSEDDNVLVTGVVGNKYAIGYFGYSYYAENKDKLKVVPIDGGNGPVEPTNETIENGTYTPFSRPLFIYVKHESLQKPHVYDFVQFFLTNAGDLAEDVGYVRLPDEKYEEALNTLEGLK